jgi:hypothetical protein
LIASGAQVHVHTGDVDIVLGAVDMPALFADGDFSATDLNDAHAALQSAGIDAPGYFCLFAANTAQGLSVVLLLDQPTSGLQGDPNTVSLGVESLFSGGGNMLVNHDAGGWWYEYDLPEGLLGTGTLQWVHGDSGAGIVWTGLDAISTIDLSLFDVGNVQDVLNTPVLQLLSAGDKLTVVHQVSFDNNDAIHLGMDLTAIPTPSTWLFGLCVGLGIRRRRRS